LSDLRRLDILRFAMNRERVARRADCVVKLGHGKALAVDAAVIVAAATAGGRKQVTGAAVKKKTEAHDAEKDHEHGLRLTAEKLHHTATTLPGTTKRDDMIVA